MMLDSSLFTENMGCFLLKSFYDVVFTTEFYPEKSRSDSFFLCFQSFLLQLERHYYDSQDHSRFSRRQSIFLLNISFLCWVGWEISNIRECLPAPGVDGKHMYFVLRGPPTPHQDNVPTFCKSAHLPFMWKSYCCS